jgi:aryl-phospho-beta-D-glucosidase BglC (GH1 family)
MATGFLKVSGDKIVDDTGKSIILRGAGLGGWLNMENFITGYPGHEHEHRAAMKAVLGPEKYEYFFDRWLYYFFTEDDARFFASLGLNCLRLPFNYRHLEDDMNPRVLKEEGFKHLDRVIELCAKHGIYTILDMHALPGGQNPDWHSDNPSAYAAFWDFKDHQDRTVWLWERIAERYRDNTWVAGYNPINEPCDPEHWRLPAFYARLEPAIRKIDKNHILWLDGNTFAMEWKFFEPLVQGPKKLENCAFSLHDYASYGFPSGEPYVGNEDQNQKLEKQFLRKASFMHENKVAAWNGEFGPVYENPRYSSHGERSEEINQQRYNLLGQQLRIYDKFEISWSIWLYKDIGLQGMVYLDPESRYMKTIQKFLEKKHVAQLDAWGTYPSKKVADVLDPFVVCNPSSTVYVRC